MATYRLSLAAQSDVDGITTYTALNFGERQAVTYTDSIHAAAQITANFPNLGRPYTTRQGRSYRQYNIGRHALFYRPDEEGIVVIRVLHLMMDFDTQLDR